MERLIVNQSELASWVAEVESPIDIAVAFWGDGAIESFQLDRPGRRFRILLDLKSGATNPDVVRRLMKIAPSHVRSVRRLHAKMYLSAEEVIVGSTNASANGLGIEGSEATRWHELSLLSNDRMTVTAASAWFKRQWTQSEKITPELLDEAQASWDNSRRLVPLPAHSGRSLLAAVLAEPSEFKRKGLFVAVDTKRLSNKDQQHLEQIRRGVGHPIYAWTDWTPPKHARIICFTNFEEDRFDIDRQPGCPEGVYYSADPSRGRLKFVTASHVPGYERRVGSMSEWKPLLLEAKRRHDTWKKYHGLCMDLGDFVEEFGPRPPVS